MDAPLSPSIAVTPLEFHAKPESFHQSKAIKLNETCGKLWVKLCLLYRSAFLQVYVSTFCGACAYKVPQFSLPCLRTGKLKRYKVLMVRCSAFIVCFQVALPAPDRTVGGTQEANYSCLWAATLEVTLS